MLMYILLFQYCVLCYWWGKDKSDDEGQEQGVDTMDIQIVADVDDLQSSASACSSNITTPPPLTPCTRPAPGRRM